MEIIYSVMALYIFLTKGTSYRLRMRSILITYIHIVFCVAWSSKLGSILVRTPQRVVRMRSARLLVFMFLNEPGLS